MRPSANERAIIVGDLNVAPLEHDVWSHKQLLKVVSHTPIECEKLTAVQNAGNWIDIARHVMPEPEKIYTWWSYRAPDWAAANKGRRLDHIWVSQALGDRFHGFKIARDARGWRGPSDHVPVTTDGGSLAPPSRLRIERGADAAESVRRCGWRACCM